jgi:monoamine oxidase
MREHNADFDVVIVGGGAAGIGAARHLASSGLSTVLLEAGPRLGGRAWTQEIAGLALDLGCGWMHSAEKNAWVGIASDAGIGIDRSRAAWGQQYRDLGFTPAEQAEAHRAFDGWMRRMAAVRETTDRAADALEPGNPWNTFIGAIVGYISGAKLESMSATDYLAYDEASTESNWRSPSGLGALIAGSFPAGVALRLATPVQAIGLEGPGVTVGTPRGTLRARAALLTVSTAVLAGDALTLPVQLDPWREAAKLLPLGHNEKLFLEILGEAPFDKESQVLGNPRASCTGSYYLRPLDLPVIECFLGGESARLAQEEGTSAAFAFALDQLSALFGAQIRAKLRPLLASAWGRTLYVGGAYSYALPRHADARRRLALPFEQRLFFAGEATHVDEFSTAHGAHDTGVRAAAEINAALT